jgi:DNA-directed RNA polymerase specialized sigma24 family protein
MELNEIIAKIYCDEQLKSLCQDVAKQNAEDLFHEVICQLFDKPNKVKEVQSKGYLKLYVARMIIWQNNDKYSRYAKKYRNGGLEKLPSKIGYHAEQIEDYTALPDEPEIDHAEINRLEVKALEKINREAQLPPPNFYPARLVLEVSECKSFIECSRKTGIPVKSVIYTYRKYIKEVQEHCLKS